MQHRSSPPLARAWHRLKAATGRLRGERPRRVAFRALVTLVATLSLGGGAYAVGTLLVGGPPDRPAESAGSPVPGDDEGPSPTRQVPESGPPTPDATGRPPSPSPTGSPAAPTPTTPATPAARSSLSRAAGSPSPGTATPSTSPSPPGATASATPEDATPGDATPGDATPEDDTPPQTRLSEAFPAGDVALFSFSADEPATFACSLDEAAYTPCAAVARYSDLDPGWHTLSVRATDSAGNVDPSPAGTSWHVSDTHSGP